MIKIISLSQPPQSQEKSGHVLELEGTPSCDRRSQGDCSPQRRPASGTLPFDDRYFTAVKAADLPYSLLNGERLKQVLAEVYRVLEPGGEVRIETQIERTCRPEERGPEPRSIRSHWMKEAHAPCGNGANERELEEKLDEAGFEDLKVWKEPTPAPFQKLTLIAVKPETPEN